MFRATGRWKRTRRARWAAAVGVLALAGLAPLASAVPDTDGNPDLPSSCGVDATLILDDSASIGTQDANQVRAAAQLFADALVGTPSSLKVITFDSRARGVSAAGSLTSALSSVVFRDPAAYAAPTSGAGQGGTNWDDGLEVARRSAGGPGDLVVFITDGDPTYRNATQPDGHANDGSHALAGSGSSVSTDNLNAAITEADAIKDAGAHLFGIGVGLTAAASEQRLNDVTGDEELTLDGNGVPSQSFGDADYTIAPNFSQLQPIVEAFVRDLCAPSLNVTKELQRADGSTSVAGASEPWTFTASLDSAPSEWTSPAGASGASATGTTDGSGGVSFKWDMDAASATVDLTEQAKPGWVYNGARCTLNALDGSEPTVIFDTVGANVAGAQGDPSELLDLDVDLEKAINCDVYNREVRPATIQVTKQTLPAGLDDEFSFTLASGQQVLETKTGISHGETATFASVAPGTYTVAEARDPHYDLAASTCDVLGTQAVEELSPVGIEVGEGQSVRCTFVNTAHPGTITVVKKAEIANGTFEFTSDVPDLGEFSLTTQGGALGGQASTETITVPVGTYAISEDTPAPWTLTGATCTGEQAPSAVFVGAGRDVVCTFTNRAPDPEIELTKTAGVASVAEPGGAVTYTVELHNPGIEPLWVDTLVDSIEGGPDLDVTQVADPITATTCDRVIGELAAGATVDCTFTVEVTGDDGDVIDDVVTVEAFDDNEGTVSDSDDASVAITEVAPTIEVTKTPSAASIAEPGGIVSYEVEVTNTGDEAVEIDAVTDVLEGAAPVDVTLSAPPVDAGTCASFVGTVIAPGGSASCTFSISHVVDRSDLDDGDLDDTVTVVASDDDGSTADTADAEVAVTDVAPTISVTKTASPATVAETAPGQTRPVDFVVGITNDSPEPVVISSITDAVDGGTPFAAEGTCAALIGTTLAPQGTTTCTFTLGVGGDVNDVVDDVVTVEADDDDGNTATDSDDASVTLTGLGSSIAVTKTASVGSVPEPGADVTFTLDITNTSQADTITLGAITDAVEGGAPVGAGGTCPSLIGTDLAPGEKVSCSFTLPVSGNAGDVIGDVAAVTGTDDDGETVSGSAEESVAVTDVASSIEVTKKASVASVTEPGGPVTYTVDITNTSAADAVTIGSITDTVDGGAPFAVAGTCDDLVGTVIAPGKTVTCSFELDVAGDAGDSVPDTVTVTGTDDDGAGVEGSDSAVVDVTDVASAISVTKTPSVDALPEPGGTVLYTVVIENTSISDEVLLESITDEIGDGDPFDVQGTCDDLLGTVLDPGDSVTCAFTAPVIGDAGDTVLDRVTVTGTDDEEQPVEASASAVVDITDVLPTGTVTKDASPTTVAEPGGSVTFTASVTNTSTVEDATVVAIADLVDGASVDVTAVGGIVTTTTCTTGAVLDPAGTYSCTFTLAISGVDAGDLVVDQVSFTLADDDENTVTPSDTETVTVTDVLPTITVTKDNGGAVVAAPGGPVAFDVTVANTSVEPVVLEELTDSIAGGEPFDITVTSGPVTATTCATGGTVAPGGTYACEFTLAVESDDPTVETDVVEAAATDDEGNRATAGDDASTEVTPVADLAIDNRVGTGSGESLSVRSAGRAIEVGKPGGFDLEVTNLGPSTAVALQVVHELPAELVPTSASGDGWACAIAGTTVTCERPELISGASSTIVVAVDVTAAASGKVLETVATVSATTPDPALANNTDPESVDVPKVGPSDEESTTTTSSSTTTTLPGAVGPGNVDDGTLPRTGSEPGPLVAWALGLVAVGAAVLAWRRSGARRAGSAG